MLTPPDFNLATEIAYIPSGLHPLSIELDNESTEYEALSFILNDKIVKFRKGKITPTKPGFFVTLWKRANGITQPHHIDDALDFFAITVRDNVGFGQFIFPKRILLQQRIISSKSQEGKRGIRLYPPWVNTLNKQAKRSQIWQCKYFIHFDINNTIKLHTLIDAFNYK